MNMALRFGAINTGRREDAALLTGGAKFTDDIHLPGEVHAVFLRAPHGHAILRGVNAARARQMPGVLAVLTGKEVAAAGLGAIPPAVVLHGRAPMYGPAIPILVHDRVRYVGEAVAVVIAETAAQAQDAAEVIEVEYEPLPAAPTVDRASAPSATPLFSEAPGNVSLDWEFGDPHAVKAAFERATHVVGVRLLDTRVAPSSLEPRAAIASWDGHSDRYTLIAGTQGVSIVRKLLAESVFKVPQDKIRVVTYDVGGGFGMKVQPYPEYAALLFAAKHIGRPVRWCASRLESFLADTHGRDGVLDGEMALDESGRILALHVATQIGIGAYASTYAAIITTNNTKNCLSSVYAVPALHVEVKMILTNASPLGPYRGAGRPEAIYLLERLMDKAARQTGIDRVELRRRNLIPASAIPYRAATGQTYDSGEFEVVLNKALELADWNGFPLRRRESEARGLLRGIGLSCFLEVAGGSPLTETVDLRFLEDGSVTLITGAQSMGQGQATTLPILVAHFLDIDPVRIRVLQGDSDEVPAGLPTVASRSTVMVGGAVHRACVEALRKGTALAAERLETASEDIEYSAGIFRVKGSDRGVRLEELAAEGALNSMGTFNAPEMAFPNGCHVCEVEVDPETGVVKIVRYTAVDDVGNIVHPSIVEGQIHGGVAQGLGQVLGEQVIYSPEGQLLTASFMDYPMPRADDLPALRLGHHVAPCATNPAGVKGSGESGIAGSLPAAVNAVLDALATRGITHLDLPFTAERVWAVLQRRKET